EDIARRGAALGLNASQVTQLGVMAKRFDAVRDSVYTELTTYFVSLKGDYQTRAAKQHWHDSFVMIAHQYVLAGPSVRTLLSEDQFALLAPDVAAFFEMDEGTFYRLMSSMNFGVLMELITGEGID